MPEGRSTYWPAVLAALAAGVVGGASIGKMPPALPFITQEFGLSLVAAGWLVSMFNVIALLAAVFFGIASDRLGAWRFCLTGLAIQIAGGALGVLAHSAEALLASRVLEGVGFVSVVVAAPVLMAAAASAAQRGLAFGLWGTYMPTGGALMIALSPPLLAAGGWRAVWIALVVGAMLCLLWLALQRSRYAEVASPAPRSLANVRSSLGQPVPWLLGGAFAVYTLQFYTVMVWLPTYLLETRGLGATASSLLTALYILFNAGGNFTGGFLVHRGARRGPTIGGSLAITALMFVGIFSTGLPDLVRYGLVLAYGFTTGVIPPMANSGLTLARSPGEAGGIQGLIVQLSNIGTFVGPPIVASVVTASGSWESARWVLLVAACIGIAFAIAMHRIESRPTANARGPS